MAALKRDYLPDDLQPDLRAAGFDGCVAVQASQSEAETDFLLNLAKRHPFIRGVVGWVDLRAEDAADRLAGFARNPLLRGIRHGLQDEPDDRFMLRPDFRRGLGYLKQFGLCYDLLIHPKHLPVALELVRAFPDQPFVLDHLAKPFVREQRMAPWGEDMRALAACSNVSCKLSGLVTEAVWGKWQPVDFRPYLDLALEAFGPDRLLIGSDWPVCRLSASYGETMRLITDYLHALSETERAKITGLTAARVYRLR